MAVSPAEGAAADITTAGMWAFDAQHGQVGASWTGEFLPNTVAEQRWAIGRAPSDGSSAASLAPVALAAEPEAIGYLDATYQVMLAQPGILILHRFDYPAWEVTVDGAGVPSRPVGSLGQLGVDLPAGAHRVTITWGATPAVWFGRLLTVVGWGVVLWLLLQTRRRRWAVVTWCVVGALFLLGASGVLAEHARPTPIGADFGPVRLEAVRAEQVVHASQTAAVNLTWSISGPVEPLTVFVHVLGSDGAVVAQQDAPLGGEYAPVERWLPGLVLETAQRIPIPADLPTGKYALKAGVYRPGAADAPLAPVGAADPRVDAGVLEVQR
ncbi:MAG: hypothetical protein IPK16_15125 [Anaerolineales bacterium]|nr:hypothetical protein [Anaerolineales bacterium]